MDIWLDNSHCGVKSTEEALGYNISTPIHCLDNLSSIAQRTACYEDSEKIHWITNKKWFNPVFSHVGHLWRITSLWKACVTRAQFYIWAFEPEPKIIPGQLNILIRFLLSIERLGSFTNVALIGLFGLATNSMKGFIDQQQPCLLFPHSSFFPIREKWLFSWQRNDLWYLVSMIKLLETLYILALLWSKTFNGYFNQDPWNPSFVFTATMMLLDLRIN